MNTAEKIYQGYRIFQSPWL